MPPDTFETTRVLAPSAPSTRTGKTTSAGEYPSYRWKRPEQAATRFPARVPRMSSPV